MKNRERDLHASLQRRSIESRKRSHRTPTMKPLDLSQLEALQLLFGREALSCAEFLCQNDPRQPNA